MFPLIIQLKYRQFEVIADALVDASQTNRCVSVHIVERDIKYLPVKCVPSIFEFEFPE